MNLPTRILVCLSTLLLALALGLACEGGEEVTREDVEEALLGALGDDADLEAIEEGVREALDENPDTPTGASTSLHTAVGRADASEVQALLDEGADVNARNEDGQTPLHIAAERGEIAVLEALLDRGANIDATDMNGATPLLLATFNESPMPVIELLLTGGADPNAGAEGEAKALHLAVSLRNPALVQLLLDHGATPNIRDPLGETPLHYASIDADPAIARMLLAQGADPNATDDIVGWSPLHIAAQSGDLEFVQLLLDNGADINAQDGNRETPLLHALQNSHDMVEFLLDRGADATAEANGGLAPCRSANVIEGYAGTLLLERLCTAEAMALLDSITESQPRSFGPVSTIMPHLSPLQTDFDHQLVSDTPLHRAVVGGNIDDVLATLTQGPNLDAQATIRLTGHGSDLEWSGMTPLHLAALNSDPAVTEALIARGANVNARGQYGLTPLHTAARLGGLEHVRALFSAGAQIEARDDEGRTPLHWAVEGDPNALMLLLDLGANIEAKNNDGFTPLHWAAAYVEAVASLLVRRAADTLATEDMGRTPCQVYGIANQGVGRRAMTRLLCPSAVASGPASTEPVEPLVDVEWVTETALHRAAYGRPAAEVSQILDQGANIHATVTVKPDRAELAPLELTGTTPLHLAMLSSDASVASLLVDRGANIEARSAGGWTPLLWAAIYGNEDAAVEMLQKGANPNVADSIRNFTPLHWAAENRDRGMVRVLMDRGADPSATEKQGITPCQVGLNNGYTRNERFMERLCLNYTPPAPPVEGVVWFTETPLHRAAYDGSLEEVRSLLDRGADIEAKADIAFDGLRWEGVTPLHVATLNPDLAVAGLLLDRGADIHARAFANGWWPVVHFALLSQRSDELQSMINFLVSRGATI